MFFRFVFYYRVYDTVSLFFCQHPETKSSAFCPNIFIYFIPQVSLIQRLFPHISKILPKIL